MLNVWELEFIGLMYGDGCRAGRGRQCSLYVKDEDVEEIERKVLGNLEWKYSKHVRKSKNDHVVEFRFGVDVVKLLGWFEKKEIKDLTYFTDEELGSVLRGCFESDGWATLLGDVGFEVNSEELARFVFEGVGRLGIEASFNVWKGSRNSFAGIESLRYCVRIKRNSLGSFIESIGFITSRKLKRINRRVYA